MAYVDEYYVQAYLTENLKLPAVTYVAVPAEDESVDAEVQVHVNGQYAGLHVQCGGGYLAVGTTELEAPGSACALTHHLNCGTQASDLAKVAQLIQQLCASRHNELWEALERVGPRKVEVETFTDGEPFSVGRAPLVGVSGNLSDEEILETVAEFLRERKLSGPALCELVIKFAPDSPL